MWCVCCWILRIGVIEVGRGVFYSGGWCLILVDWLGRRVYFGFADVFGFPLGCWLAWDFSGRVLGFALFCGYRFGYFCRFWLVLFVGFGFAVIVVRCGFGLL